MKKYIIPFLAYILTGMLAKIFFDEYVSYAIKTTITLGLILYFWKDYNFKFKFKYRDFFVGFLIFIIWILLDIGFSKEAVIPPNMIFLIFKIVGMIFVAAVIEELFTRDFLMRYLIDPNNYKKVKIGAYSAYSFVVTVLFFGFSHQLWVAGLITGIVLNLYLYNEKSIERCIVAHSSANLFLIIYVLVTSSYWLW